MPTTHLAHRFSNKSGPNPPTKYTSGYIESWGKPACQKPLGKTPSSYQPWTNQLKATELKLYHA